jgi:Short C-terminal domain
MHKYIATAFSNKDKQMKRIGIGSLLIVALLGLSACGSRSRTTTNVTSVSTGQQLTDLKAALDSGAMTQSEYDKKRKKILKNG